MIKNINGLNINYSVSGDGNTVVLLHGWGSNISLFSSMTEILSKKYRVIAMDLPGFGKSDEPKKSWCVEDYADFVVDFLKDFNCDSYTFLGHSFGGRIILKLFEKKPPFKIEKVILTGSAGVVPKKTFKQKASLKMYKTARRFFSIAPMKLLFPNAVDKMRKKRGSLDYNSASPIMRQTLVSVVNEDLTHVFPFVNVPTLLIWGKNDTATPLSDGQLMEKLMPKAGLVVLENSGHYAFLDEMFAFNKILASFMNIN